MLQPGFFSAAALSLLLLCCPARAYERTSPLDSDSGHGGGGARVFDTATPLRLDDADFFASVSGSLEQKINQWAMRVRRGAWELLLGSGTMSESALVVTDPTLAAVTGAPATNGWAPIYRQVHWAETRIHPLQSWNRWRALAFDLKAFYLTDLAPMTPHYHQGVTYVRELGEGPKPLTVAAGFSADLVELWKKESRPIWLNLGAGMTNLEVEGMPLNFQPYASVDVGYHVAEVADLQGGFLITPFSTYFESDSVWFAPNVRLVWRF